MYTGIKLPRLDLDSGRDEYKKASAAMTLAEAFFMTSDGLNTS